MSGKSKAIVALAAGALLTMVTSGATSAEEWVLKYGHVGPVNSDDQVPGEFLKSFLEARSQGQIKVEIYPAAQLGNFRDLIEQVQLNTLELTHTTVGGIASFVPELQVTDIPYMMRDDMVVEKIAQSPFMDKVRDTVMEKTGNVRLVAVGNTGRWRSFFTSKKLVKTAADMKGIKMRTINSPLQIEFVRFLGGNPTPVAWGEVYTSLQTGVIEGTKNAATDIVPTNMHEVVKNVTIDEHAYLFAFWWMSDAWLKQLPPHLQDLVVDGVQQASMIQSDWNKEYESRSLAQFQEAGGTVYVPTAEEKATFLPARDAMKVWFTEKYGDEWLKLFEQAVADAESAIDSDRKRILGR
ncbi:TRAP transporter substrate-binding protein DctP [Pelagibius sp. Alg239-R121]|uniref:TRAP transporter substrate-binding protein DctP n=1 Tax=Pelagibius sp. Alg239-R121 TaxID=2993448 RepID=UPI0024A645E2|nr:TRAP transporter substrate-binding protein DctP [Pelagibius sp. Alg239-R121]